MNILRNYKYFVKESVDSDKEVRSLNDVPGEVIESAKKIASDIFDRVKKPVFDFEPGKGLIMRFQVSEQDFNYIDDGESLSLEITEGARKKRNFDVTLKYLDRTTETFEVSYLVNFIMNEFPGDLDFDEDEDVIVKDDYEKSDDDFSFDEDEVDQQIKKGKIKIQDIQGDIEDLNDDDF